MSDIKQSDAEEKFFQRGQSNTFKPRVLDVNDPIYPADKRQAKSKYITHELIDLAKENPNKWILGYENEFSNYQDARKMAANLRQWQYQHTNVKLKESGFRIKVSQSENMIRMFAIVENKEETNVEDRSSS